MLTMMRLEDSDLYHGQCNGYKAVSDMDNHKNEQEPVKLLQTFI